MGQSTDGIIAFGVAFPEGFEFPWGYTNDVDDWWRKNSGFQDIHQPFTEDGEWAEGWGSQDDPRLKEYNAHRLKWRRENPFPYEMVNYCSGDYPMWALVVPGSEIRCKRGIPLRL